MESMLHQLNRKWTSKARMKIGDEAWASVNWILLFLSLPLLRFLRSLCVSVYVLPSLLEACSVLRTFSIVCVLGPLTWLPGCCWLYVLSFSCRCSVLFFSFFISFTWSRDTQISIAFIFSLYYTCLLLLDLDHTSSAMYILDREVS